ncbi:MAG: AAA family ATPase [Coriobacteriales bacterium]|jgi:superfamily I DNA/RNA helicase|nr:AAA family ATPase [Coriobacteriales bacterium]
MIGTAYLGGPGTGKTAQLIGRVQQLLAGGAAPGDILVLSASPPAAQDLAARLTEAFPAAAEIEVTTPRALALEVLASPAAQAFTGRPARLLEDFEANFFLEDLKVTGIRPQRIREILRFFYRGWTELAEADPEWLITVEEKTLHELILSDLRFIQGLLEPEISKLTLEYLRTDAAAGAARRRAHVLVDDYQLLSRASQLLAGELAGESLTISADRGASVEVFESYPYAAGVDDFVSAWPDGVVELTAGQQAVGLIAAQNNLRTDEAFVADKTLTAPEGAAGGEITVQSFASAEAEFSGAAELAAALAAGTTAGKVGIATFNRLWRKHLLNALQSAGLEVAWLPDTSVLSGDIRDRQRSSFLQAFTLLRLAGDPADSVSWRAWCGFGDWLTNSAIVASLREYAQTEGRSLSFLEALEQVAAGPTGAIAGIERLIEPLREGQAILAQLPGQQGRELLEAIAQAVSADDPRPIIARFNQLLAGADIAGMSAADLTRLLEQRLNLPVWINAGATIRLAQATDLIGSSFASLMVCGCNNGFFPPRDYFDATIMPLDKQAKQHSHDVQLFSLLIGSATEQLRFTWFERSDLENAEKLKLKIARIRMEKGKRICLLAPSEMIGFLGDIS